MGSNKEFLFDFVCKLEHEHNIELTISALEYIDFLYTKLRDYGISARMLNVEQLEAIVLDMSGYDNFARCGE